MTPILSNHKYTSSKYILSENKITSSASHAAKERKTRDIQARTLESPLGNSSSSNRSVLSNDSSHDSSADYLDSNSVDETSNTINSELAVAERVKKSYKKNKIKSRKQSADTKASEQNTGAEAKSNIESIKNSSAEGMNSSNTLSAPNQNIKRTTTDNNPLSFRKHTGKSKTNNSSSESASSALAKKAKERGKLRIMRRQQAGMLSKSSAESGKQATQAVAKAAKSVGRLIRAAMVKLTTSPVTLIILFIVLVIIVLVCIIASVVGAAGGAQNTSGYGYVAKVSEKTESYRSQVTAACEKYGIPEYVELALAVIEQESGGNPPDVMQAAQSPYNKNPPIDTAEESIDCGIQELRDVLKSAKVANPSDIQAISLALQGYNYGNGYIAWAVRKNGGYTKENAKEFSDNMKSKYGYRVYGDPDYVPHVLRYYVPAEGATVSNEDAQKILKELMENNDASAGVWSMISKGASLIGKVSYSMDGRQADGRNNPTVLDCSAFTAWTLRKGGYNKVSYSSTTTTFRTSSAFKDINAKDLQPGDIGLKSETAGSGGANHVGIYCGKLKDGRKIWLHCTSSSSTSLTGNRSGVMFGAYTNFTYFRRYIG